MTGLRIAYVVGTVGGGTGQHAAMLARGCAAGGNSVTVFGPAQVGRRYFADARAPAWEGASGGPAGGAAVTFVPVEIADRPRPAHDGAAVLRLRRLLARSVPDVVHAHGLRAGAAAALALTGRRTALAVTVHNAPPGGSLAGAVYTVLERIVARRSDVVACVSSDLAARMSGLGAAGVCRALVPAAPAPVPAAEAVTAVRAGLGAVGHPVVLAAGRLAAQKGFATLLAAAGRWRGHDPDPVLVLAGQGPLDQALRAQADAGGIRARFLGQRDDVPALLAAADVVVVPSLWEGQPLIVQEALRAGRPLVASRAGGIPDLTGEDGALLVPPGDAPALAAAVLAVLADPAIAARLSSAAHARAAALPTQEDAVAAALALYGRMRPRQRPLA
jgi:glycosyltransferase involved in cell wall biosynthesis